MNIKTFLATNPPPEQKTVVLVFPKDYTNPFATSARYENGIWYDMTAKKRIPSDAVYSECYWFDIPPAPEENVYEFIERVGKRVSERYGLKDNPALSSINADKARQYRGVWEEAGIPFLYGAFIYVMTTTHPYSSMITDRSKVAEWVTTFWNDNSTFRRIIREEDTGKAYFTIYWLHGQRQVIEAKPGEPIHEAFTRAGYGAGATRAIDFYEEGDVDDYAWDPEQKKWEKT